MYRLRDNEDWTLTCWKNGTSGSVLGSSPDIYHSITLVQINSEPSFLQSEELLNSYFLSWYSKLLFSWIRATAH